MEKAAPNLGFAIQVSYRKPTFFHCIYCDGLSSTKEFPSFHTYGKNTVRVDGPTWKPGPFFIVPTQKAKSFIEHGSDCMYFAAILKTAVAEIKPEVKDISKKEMKANVSPGPTEDKVKSGIPPSSLFDLIG